jgi:hypothetical protein
VLAEYRIQIGQHARVDVKSLQVSPVSLNEAAAIAHSDVSPRRHEYTPILLGICLLFCIALPYVLGANGVPSGHVFYGTLRVTDDTSQYFASVRMGQNGSWLWHDPYMVGTPPPILMYSVYMFGGNLGHYLGVSVQWSILGVYLGSGMVLFFALWRLAAAWFVGKERVWFLAFALGMSGLYWLDAFLGAAGVAPVSIGTMGSPQLSGFAQALLGGHDTLGVAGHLMAMTGLLEAITRSDGRSRWRSVVYGAIGCLLISLNEPTQLPMTLGVLLTFALWWTWQSPRSARKRTLIASIWIAGLIFLPAVPFVVYYRLQFTQGIWSTGGFRSIPAPAGIEPLLTWICLLPLGAWGFYRAPLARRPLAVLLALWCVCAIAGRELPFWQSIRLTDGINIATGMLFALGVLRPGFSRVWRQRALLSSSFSTLTYFVFLLLVLAPGNAIHFYDTSARQAAFRWLAQTTSSADVVLAPYDFSNALPAVAPDRLVFGHPWQTLDFASRQRMVRAFYGTGRSPAAHLQALLNTGATLVVYDSADSEDGSYDPRLLPGLHAVFSNAQVTILRVPAMYPNASKS